jgi:hypothetical protein
MQMRAKNNRFFVHLYEKNFLEREELVIGTTKATLSSIGSSLVPKTGRKIANLLTYIKNSGLVDKNLFIGESTIQYTSGYAPGFTFVKMEDAQSKGWYVHARVFSLDTTTISDDPLLIFKNHTLLMQSEFVSGICLFGASGIEGFTEDGTVYKMTETVELSTIRKKIIKLKEKELLHPYEIDLILRLSNFLSFVSARAPLDLHMHIPVLEYKLYGLLLYQKKLMDKNLLLQWYDIVDRRSERIRQLLQSTLPKKIILKQISPLGPIKKYLTYGNSSSPILLIDKLAQKLSADISWKFLLKSNGIPKDYIELVRLSYQAAYLQVAMKAPLLVAIEDPPEVKIWDKLKKNVKAKREEWFACGGKSIACIGLYIHPNTLLSENGGYNNKSDMFSTTAPVTVNTIKEILRFYKTHAPKKIVIPQNFQQLVEKVRDE